MQRAIITNGIPNMRLGREAYLILIVLNLGL